MALSLYAQLRNINVSKPSRKTHVGAANLFSKPRTCSDNVASSFCTVLKDGKRRNLVVKSIFSDDSIELNPQNVPSPKIVPGPSFTAREIVEIQLNALKDNDEPLQNHGMQTMYEFADGVGSMDPCLYFGYKKDLYHFDHFMGIFGTKLGNLIDLRSFELTDVTPEVNSKCQVKARVKGSKGTHVYVFSLKKREIGRLRGSWMTESVVLEKQQ